MAFKKTRCRSVLFGTFFVTCILIALLGLALRGGVISESENDHEGFGTHWFREGVVVPLFIHIIGASLALMLIPFQFSDKFRKSRQLVHNRMGWVIIISMAVGAISALIIAPAAWGGISNTIGFSTLGLAWLLCSSMGIYFIKWSKHEKSVRMLKHKIWMIRAGALMFAAVTLRIQIPIGMIITSGNFDPVYQIQGWSCWVPNIIIAEIWIRHKHSRGAKLLESETKSENSETMP